MNRQVLRIGILDNDPCALELIATIVKESWDFAHLRAESAVTTFPTAMLRMCTDPVLPLDVALVDIALNGTSGVDLASKMRARAPRTLIVGMTAYETSLYRHHVDEGTFDALLDKAALRAQLPSLLSRAAAYAQVGGPKPHDVCNDPRARRLALLTNKELELLTMSADGLSAPVIARRLGIQESTVFSYRRNIKRKVALDDWYDVLDMFRGHDFGDRTCNGGGGGE